MKLDRARTLLKAAQLLSGGETDAARALMSAEYPFRPRASLTDAVRETGLPVPRKRSPRPEGEKQVRLRRKLLPAELHALFTRSNYRCAYSGARLISPPALLVLSLRMPMEFPCTNYPNCPLATTHIGHWFLYPSLDHVEPFSSGGQCVDTNLVTASSAVNMIKSASGLAALNWPPPRTWNDSDGWDGLTSWFLDQIKADAQVADHSSYSAIFRSWAAAITANPQSLK